MQLYSLFITLLTLLTCSPMNAQDLNDYRWTNRILVLSDKAIDTEPLRSQLRSFTANKEALVERDLIIFLVTDTVVHHENGEPTKMNAERLRKNLGIENGFTGTVLIGKDGGVKMKEEFPVDPETVFTRIDGMPMRRAEMRKSKKS